MLIRRETLSLTLSNAQGSRPQESSAHNESSCSLVGATDQLTPLKVALLDYPRVVARDESGPRSAPETASW